MVFFSCDGCGEMLKKNKVDAHAARCRRCASVSCVDCSVSFWGGTLNGCSWTIHDFPMIKFFRNSINGVYCHWEQFKCFN
mmetsp:Transcript_77/g.176  ORF Transcript_77/g.176 Transcript_77/m.176 type:complete len:80 (-) Transcript_77:91-330(-)